ncbi:MAG: hypothetical protein AB1505_24540 [Candidatus Latescibacterota bacterium]
MAYRHFRLRCLVRILVLGATIHLFLYLLTATQYRATTLVVGLVVAYQVWGLIHYVEKTNRDLTRFLLSIRHADFSQSFTGMGLGSSFDELKRAFQEVLDAFRRERAGREEHARYLQTVVQHVGVGLIAFRNSGQVDLVNNAARRLLRVPRLHHLRSLAERFPSLAESLLRF